MWEFRKLSASKPKGYVKTVATKFNSLDREVKAIIVTVAIWLLLCIGLYLNNTESDAIDMEYYDSIDNSETERLAWKIGLPNGLLSPWQ